MRHFKPEEFREFWDIMDEELLEMLDEFREEWGKPVRISPHPLALGRFLGPDNESQHNVDKWGMVLAVDCFPEGMDCVEERRRAFQIAKDVGFTGIGLYTDTQPQDMLHVDARIDRESGDPAIWARVKGKYVSIYEVL